MTLNHSNPLTIEKRGFTGLYQTWFPRAYGCAYPSSNRNARLSYEVFCAANTAMLIVVADATAFHAVCRPTSILTVFDRK